MLAAQVMALLPARSSTRFIGRRGDLARLSEALDSASLVTLLGPPGVGKTRLTREHLRALGPAFFCDLSGVVTEDALWAELGHALDVDVGEGDLERRFARAIGDRIVVLDNFEQLVGTGGVPVIARLLSTVPRARWLVTSRVRLGLPQERVVELRPLPNDEGVALLVDRTQVLAPDFAIAPEEAHAVGLLVEALDGLPLAIELAAAKVRVFGAPALLERVRARFDLLTSHPSIERTSGHTLWSAIESSWVLLNERERAALCQCTIFRGGFDLDAAEAIVALEGDGPPVAEVLTRLHDRSLVSVDRGRFALLRSIRDFAETHLAPPARRALARRHAEHYRARVAERVEHDNVAAAYEDALTDATNAATRARLLELAIGLGVHETRRPYAWRAAVLERAMGLVSKEQAPRAWARALEARGNVRRFAGAIRESMADFEALRVIAHALQDRALTVQALAGLGNGHAARAAWSDARTQYEAALGEVERLGDADAEARVLAMLAAAHFHVDDPVGAERLLGRALTTQRERGDRLGVAITLTSLGAVAVARGDHPAARERLEQALALATELGSHHWEGVALTYLGLLEQDAGRGEAARARYTAALSILEAAGVRRAEAVALGHYASCLIEEGMLDEARTLASRAAELHHRTSPDHVGLMRAWTAVTSALAGDPRGARDLLDAAAEALAPYERPAFHHVIEIARGLCDGARADADDARTRPLAARSAELRAAMRIVERGARSAVISVGPDGAWFLLPGRTETARLHRRHALRRLFVALLTRHRAGRGEAMPIAALVEVGWPGERMLEQAGVERVYAAVAELRRMGLRGLLLQRDDGYLLDPALRIEEAPGPAP